MKVLLMTPDNPLCWSLWPSLESRLNRLSPEIAPESPVELLIANLRDAFIKNHLGYFTLILFDPETFKIHGHLLAWVEISWGSGLVWIHQCYTDSDVSEFYASASVEFDAWLNKVNSTLQTPITKVRWATERGGAWHRRMKKYTKFDRSILTLDSDDLKRAFMEISNVG